eukprot:UN03089
MDIDKALPFPSASFYIDKFNFHFNAEGAEKDLEAVCDSICREP